MSTPVHSRGVEGDSKQLPTMTITPEEQERIEACVAEIADILHRHTPESEITNLEGIEKTVRQHVINHISPKIGMFFIEKTTNIASKKKGKKRRIKSTIGLLRLNKKQANKLDIGSYERLSPIFKKCCFIVSANSAYGNAETEIEVMTGIKTSHSTLQRKVNKEELKLPELKQSVTEISLDGGKVRLRSEKKGEPCCFRDYKAARLDRVCYGAFFQDNLTLSDWINSQRLTNPVTCLGDGHPGIWNIFKSIGIESQRQEILDWYHLVENLYKIGGSLKRLKKIKKKLWLGQVDEAIELLKNCRLKPAKNFAIYLKKHRDRIVNYKKIKEEQYSSIGSGAVESAVKQIDARLKLAGAQWKAENVNQILHLRCAYLNGLLAI